MSSSFSRSGRRRPRLRRRSGLVSQGFLRPRAVVGRGVSGNTCGLPQGNQRFDRSDLESFSLQRDREFCLGRNDSTGKIWELHDASAPHFGCIRLVFSLLQATEGPIRHSLPSEGETAIISEDGQPACRNTAGERGMDPCSPTEMCSWRGRIGSKRSPGQAVLFAYERNPRE